MSPSLEYHPSPEIKIELFFIKKEEKKEKFANLFSNFIDFFKCKGTIKLAQHVKVSNYSPKMSLITEIMFRNHILLAFSHQSKTRTNNISDSYAGSGIFGFSKPRNIIFSTNIGNNH